MEQVIFYLSAVLLGVLLSVGLEFLAKVLKQQQLKKEAESNAIINENQYFDISEDHIQDCILPNNRGKSIDKIVENLKNHSIDPAFKVDFSYTAE